MKIATLSISLSQLPNLRPIRFGFDPSSSKFRSEKFFSVSQNIQKFPKFTGWWLLMSAVEIFSSCAKTFCGFRPISKFCYLRTFTFACTQMNFCRLLKRFAIRLIRFEQLKNWNLPNAIKRIRWHRKKYRYEEEIVALPTTVYWNQIVSVMELSKFTFTSGNSPAQTELCKFSKKRKFTAVYLLSHNVDSIY